MFLAFFLCTSILCINKSVAQADNNYVNEAIEIQQQKDTLIDKYQKAIEKNDSIAIGKYENALFYLEKRQFHQKRVYQRASKRYTKPSLFSNYTLRNRIQGIN